MSMPADDLTEYSHNADQSDWISRWIDADRVRAAAIAMILVAVAWRGVISVRGYHSQDEFVIAARAIDTDLSIGFLFEVFNGHLMPAGLAVAWLLVRVDGLAGWPWAMMLIVGQAAVSIGFYLLLRSMLRPGWALLAPLCMFLFSSLTLEVSSLWMVGLLMLPPILAMILAIAAQLRYARTGKHRYGIYVMLAVLFGLAFDTKAMLIIPLVGVLSAALFCSGGPIASLWEAIRRFWVGWVALVVLSAAYVPYYLTRPVPDLAQAESADGVMTFVRQLLGINLVPSLLGGPWQWMYAGDGPPLVDPPMPAVYAAWTVMLVLVAVTSWRRASARRAWLVLIAYAGLVTALFAVTRVGSTLGSLAGLVPRYLADAVPVAALCVGVALLGLRDVTPALEKPARPAPSWLRGKRTVRTGMVAVGAVAVTLVAGNVLSVDRFNDVWEVKNGRDYLATTQAELAGFPPGTALLEGTVPDRVVAGYFHPDNLQSHFFRAAPLKPKFVTEAVTPLMFDDNGRIRPVAVIGTNIVPGLVPNCGHRIARAQPTRIPLESPVPDWPWWVNIGYLSSAEATVTFELGGSTYTFEAQQGLSQIFFKLQAAGDTVVLTAEDPSVTICTQRITVGQIQPVQ
jgi:hypothetical protein